MAHNIRVIHACEFIRLDARGQFDLRSSRELLADIAARCANDRVDRILLDVRQSVADLQPIEIYELAHTFQDLGFERHDRVAILHRATAPERADFFATTVSRRGWQVEAFDNFEPAFHWLNEARPS